MPVYAHMSTGGEDWGPLKEQYIILIREPTFFFLKLFPSDFRVSCHLVLSDPTDGQQEDD